MKVIFMNLNNFEMMIPNFKIIFKGYVLNCCSIPSTPLAGNHGFDNE